MLNRFRENLPILTMISLIVGLLSGVRLQGRTSSKRLTEQDLLREVERGSHMPLIALSDDLTSYVNNPESIASAITKADPLYLRTTRLQIPDAYVNSMFNCTDTNDQPWFSGQLDAKSEAFDTGKPARSSPAADDGHLAAQFRASGSLYNCDSKTGRKILVATGITITAPLHPPSLLEVHKVRAWASYTSFIASLYLTFLLMLFVPTLAISLIQAIIESARSTSNFRNVFTYFFWSSLLGATIGTGTALVGAKIIPFKMTTADLEVMARSVGGLSLSSDYDPHPVLTQLARIIPTNPLGALTDSTGNSGLQVAFIATMLGFVLAALGQQYRVAISNFLKSALALVICDRDLKWRALSDYADFFAPLGVLFFTMTAFASADFKLLGDLADLSALIILALLVHSVVVLGWLRLFRNYLDWFRRAFLPGLGGLLTAFATASSYAALPAISDVPLLQADSRKRGLFNLGTTLNKSGSSVYLAAAATFIYLHYNNTPLPWLALVGIVLLSTLAGTVVAGLPFAAIVGLRMILVSVNLPGGLAWLLLPIDPVADRLVTPVNVFSNLAATSDPLNLPPPPPVTVLADAGPTLAPRGIPGSGG